MWINVYIESDEDGPIVTEWILCRNCADDHDVEYNCRGDTDDICEDCGDTQEAQR